MNVLRDRLGKRFAGRKAGVAALLLGLVLTAPAAIGQVSLSINMPGVSIGINVPTYPQLQRVPGYPVYYAPRLRSNYFFYDGMYWVYEDDDWYASSWYNGPWARVDAVAVPLFVLRIPVRYYRNPPTYFRGWRADGPPRWGEHWGRDWEQRRRGWDRWNRQSVPAPAPLPIYQRDYRGDRYPDTARQAAILGRNYQYRPRDEVVRRHYDDHASQRAPAPSEQRTAPRARDTRDERMPVRQAPPQDMRNPQPPIPQPSPRGDAPMQPRPQPMPRQSQQPPPQQQAPQQPPPQQQPPQRQPPQQQQAPRAPAVMPPPQQQQQPVPPRASPERPPQQDQSGRAPPPSSQRSTPGDRAPQNDGRPERGKDREKP